MEVDSEEFKLLMAESAVDGLGEIVYISNFRPANAILMSEPMLSENKSEAAFQWEESI